MIEVKTHNYTLVLMFKDKKIIIPLNVRNTNYNNIESNIVDKYRSIEELKKEFTEKFDNEVIDVYIEEEIYILSPGISTEKNIKHYLNFNKRKNEPSLLNSLKKRP